MTLLCSPNHFLSCDQIDYSFLHKNVCHCQHQKTFLLSSGSTFLIDWVPSEYFTHTKHLNLSDFKSKVSRATKQYSTHLIWLFLFFLVIIELCKSRLDPDFLFRIKFLLSGTHNSSPSAPFPWLCSLIQPCHTLLCTISQIQEFLTYKVLQTNEKCDQTHTVDKKTKDKFPIFNY